MRCDVFIKGCRSQLHWLSYALQLLEKNWQSPGNFIVLLDLDCADIVRHWGLSRTRYLFVDPWPDPYMHALWCKAEADLYTVTDPVMMIDSDTMLSEPAKVEDFMAGDRLILPYLSWDTPSQEPARSIWPKVVKNSTGLDIPYDFMVTRPWIYWRSTFEGARRLVENYWHKDFKEAVYSDYHYDWTRYGKHPFTFCDLENLGLYAYLEQRDQYDFREGQPKTPFLDMWSHTEFSEVQERLDDLLNSPVLPF
jgi:hypothetical protein